ncbi:MAG: EAL domain-containing protein [Nitrospinota bacterium]|nr:EAL domain-containing protein [Nitrospinota bacterium]
MFESLAHRRSDIEKEKISFLISVITAAVIMVGSTAIGLSYLASFEQQKLRLIETAQGEARLIEMVAEHVHQKSSGKDPEVAFNEILDRIVKAHKGYSGFGKTGEFTLAKLVGNQIAFLLSHRRNDQDEPKLVAFDSQLAEPMRNALKGESGSIIVLDYRGVRVLAAYEPVEWQGRRVGIVAKMDLSEIRAPFARAGLISALCAFIIVGFGAYVFRWLTAPAVLALGEGSKLGRAEYWLALTCGVLAILIFLLDITIPLGVAGGVPYVAPVLISLWSARRYFTIAMATVASLLTIAGLFLSPEGGDIWVALINRFLAISIIWVAAFLALLQREARYKALDSARKLEEVQKIAHVGSWAWNVDTNEVEWSDEIFRIFGRKPDELQPTYDAYLEVIHPDDRKAVTSALEDSFNNNADYNIEHRIVMPDNEVRHVHEYGFLYRDKANRPQRMVCAVHDLTERKRTEENLRRKTILFQLLQELAVATNEVSTLDEALKICLEKVCAYTGWPIGHLYLCDQENKLFPTETWSLSDQGRFKQFIDVTMEMNSMSGMELPGRVLRDGKPHWVFDLANEKDCLRSDVAIDVGIKGAFAFPVMEGKQVVAVLEFFSLETSGPDSMLMEIITNLGALLGRVTERKRAEERIKASEARYSAIFDQASDAIVLVDPKDGKTIEFNDLAHQRLGYTREEFAKISVPDYEVNESPEEVAEHIEKLVKEGSDIFETRHRTKSGELRDILVNTRFIDIGPEKYILATYSDITERKEAEEQLMLAALVYENAAEGVMVTDADGIIQHVNPSFTRITGYSSEEVIGKSPSLLKSGRHDETFYGEMWLSLKEKDNWHGDIWNRSKKGVPYLVRENITAIKDSEGKVYRYASVFHDITELNRNEEEIKYQAYHDLLTGLPNRWLFNDRLKQAIGRAARDEKKFALLFVDIDDFKKVNDNYSHHSGDLLIQGVGMRLTACVRDTDTVSRYAGDEFVIIIENVKGEKDVASVAAKIIDSIADPYSYQGKNIHSTVSVGIAMYPADGKTEEELVRNADLAMYHVKDGSKNNYSFFTKTLDEKATRLYELEYRMRAGVERDEFIAYYQPKVSLVDGSITGLEALARWNSDGNLVVNPDFFIPLAEDNGLIVQIGERILFSACEQLKTWQEMGWPDLVVSVNISVRQLERGSFPEVLRATLASTGLRAESLCLEVTETTIMKDMTKALATLHEIKKMGINISLDDFGTGYSSLSHVRKFPIDELKIDRFFVMTIPESQEDMAMVSTIVAMARNLNLRVVAEGVETRAQMEFLRSIGCDEIQGYLFGPPVAAKDMETALSEGRKLVIE